MRCASRADQSSSLPSMLLRSLLLIVSTVALASFAPARAQNQEPPKKGKSSKVEKAAAAADLPAVLWRDPGDISSLDLINGIGGAQDAPGENEEYKFVKEDLNGTSTKFYVRRQGRGAVAREDR